MRVWLWLCVGLSLAFLVLVIALTVLAKYRHYSDLRTLAKQLWDSGSDELTESADGTRGEAELQTSVPASSHSQQRAPALAARAVPPQLPEPTLAMETRYVAATADALGEYIVHLKLATAVGKGLRELPTAPPQATALATVARHRFEPSNAAIWRVGGEAHRPHHLVLAFRSTLTADEVALDLQCHQVPYATKHWPAPPVYSEGTVDNRQRRAVAGRQRPDALVQPLSGVVRSMAWMEGLSRGVRGWREASLDTSRHTSHEQGRSPDSVARLSRRHPPPPGWPSQRTDRTSTGRSTETAMVHAGFWQAYAELRSEMHHLLNYYSNEHTRSLWITGHSLGGALATLAAMDLSHPANSVWRFPVPLTAIVFGAPRLGNPALHRWLQSLQNSPAARLRFFARVNNHVDVITHMMPVFVPDLPYLLQRQRLKQQHKKHRAKNDHASGTIEALGQPARACGHEYSHCGQGYTFHTNHYNMWANHALPTYLQGCYQARQTDML